MTKVFQDKKTRFIGRKPTFVVRYYQVLFAFQSNAFFPAEEQQIFHWFLLRIYENIELSNRDVLIKSMATLLRSEHLVYFYRHEDIKTTIFWMNEFCYFGMVYQKIHVFPIWCSDLNETQNENVDSSLLICVLLRIHSLSDISRSVVRRFFMASLKCIYFGSNNRGKVLLNGYMNQILPTSTVSSI